MPIDLYFDWIWLYVQIFILVFIAGRELFKHSNRNLFAILVPLTILILVQGQTWWVFKQFEITNQIELQIVMNTFSRDVARTANLYIGLGIISYFLTFLIYKNYRSKLKSPTLLSEITLPKPTRSSYIFAGIWTLSIAILLINKVGGLETAINEPGQMIGGQTVLILAIGLAKWPLILKIIRKQKINIIDISFFIVAVLITLFNSRFLAIFALLQLWIAINYCRKEISPIKIALMTIPLLVILFVFGIYRDFAYRFGTTGFEAFSKYDETSINFDVLDWFYYHNVEGFTGLAGLINYKRETGGFMYDFGISELSIFLNYIPNSIRNDPNLFFLDISNFFKDIYPFSASVVPSGVELSFGHFGLIGILLYFSLLGFLTAYFHYQGKKIGPHQVTILLLSVQLLSGVRGSLFGSIMFFGLADLITMWIYRVKFKINKTKINETSSYKKTQSHEIT